MAASAAAAFVLEGASPGTGKRPASCTSPADQSPAGPKLRLSWGSCAPPTKAGLGSPTICSAEKFAKCEKTLEEDNGKPFAESPMSDTLSSCEASSQCLKKYSKSLTLRLVDEAKRLQPVEQLRQDDTGLPRDASREAPPSTSWLAQDLAACPVCAMPPHQCECSTLEVGGLNESDSLTDKAEQNSHSKSLADDGNSLEKHALCMAAALRGLLKDYIWSKPFHLLLTGIPLPLLVDNAWPNYDYDCDWAAKICNVLAKGIDRVVDHVGTYDFLDGALLHRLLEDHQADVAKICYKHHAKELPPPTFARTSRALVVPRDSQDVDVTNRYNMVLDLRNDTHQFILRLQVANLRGHRRQLGQFVLNFDTEIVVEEHPAYVCSHQLPFNAVMLLRGVMQVIEWYGDHNVFLSQVRIKALMKSAMTYWRDTKKLVSPKPDEST